MTLRTLGSSLTRDASFSSINPKHAGILKTLGSTMKNDQQKKLRFSTACSPPEDLPQCSLETQSMQWCPYHTRIQLKKRTPTIPKPFSLHCLLFQACSALMCTTELPFLLAGKWCSRLGSPCCAQSWRSLSLQLDYLYRRRDPLSLEIASSSDSESISILPLQLKDSLLLI